MLLLALIQSVLAGGAPEWSADQFPIMAAPVQPITVDAENTIVRAVRGSEEFTVVKVTNNTDDNLDVMISTLGRAEDVDDLAVQSFRISEENGESCRTVDEAGIPEVNPPWLCRYTLAPGQSQRTFISFFTPFLTGDISMVLKDLTVDALPLPVADWNYRVHVPLMGLVRDRVELPLTP